MSALNLWTFQPDRIERPSCQLLLCDLWICLSLVCFCNMCAHRIASPTTSGYQGLEAPLVRCRLVQLRAPVFVSPHRTSQTEEFALTGYIVPGRVEDGTWMLWENSSAAVVAVAHPGLGEDAEALAFPEIKCTKMRPKRICVLSISWNGSAIGQSAIGLIPKIFSNISQQSADKKNLLGHLSCSCCFSPPRIRVIRTSNHQLVIYIYIYIDICVTGVVYIYIYMN